MKLLDLIHWKRFSVLVKYIVLPCSSLVGIIYGFDMYIISRAQTVVEPVKKQVELIVPTIDKIDKRTMRIEDILLTDRK